MPSHKNYLKGLIVTRHGSQTGFARSIRVHPSEVTHFISGRRTPTPEKKKLWAKALRKPIRELFPEERD